MSYLKVHAYLYLTLVLARPLPRPRPLCVKTGCVISINSMTNNIDFTAMFMFILFC